MLHNLSDLTKALLFYGLAIGLMTAACLLYPVLGETVVVVAMYTPLAATLLMLLIVTPDGRTKAGWASLGLHRPGFKAWPAAILVPLVVLGGSYAIVWSSGLAGFGLTGDLEGLAVWMLPVFALIIIVQHLATGALGEEIGWRGYLLPRLVEALGPRWALPLSGFLHGLWHLPIVLLTPLYHADGNLLIVLPLMLTGSTVLGVILGYLRLATGSVLPAAIMHSSINVFWALLRMSTVAAPPLVTEYLAGESGVLPLAGYAIAAAVVALLLSRSASHQPRPVAL